MMRQMMDDHDYGRHAPAGEPRCPWCQGLAAAYILNLAHGLASHYRRRRSRRTPQRAPVRAYARPLPPQEWLDDVDYMEMSWAAYLAAHPRARARSEEVHPALVTATGRGRGGVDNPSDGSAWRRCGSSGADTGSLGGVSWT